MKIKDIIDVFEQFAPSIYAENYDNVGLLVGDAENEIKGVLLTLDVVEESIDEAIERGANLIISHHPIIFSGLKSLTGRSSVERIVMRAIENKIAIFAVHTNIDSVSGGVSFRLGEVLGLKNLRVLSAVKDTLVKVVFYVPISHADKVREVISSVGAGAIGNYDSCTFSVVGEGRFRANDSATPYCGAKGELHCENEQRIETIVSKYEVNRLISAVKGVHPYEEPAYDIFPLKNVDSRFGLGVVGELEESVDATDFLRSVKAKLGLPMLKCSSAEGKSVKQVALCGGSGASFIGSAISSGADIYLTGDIKYHDYFSAENKIIIADIGHFESEQFTLDIFYDVLIKKIINFAVYKTALKSNPINYL